MTALGQLALAMAAFVGSHLILSHPLRARLVRELGERGFLGLYSAVAALTLAWVVVARRAAPAEPLWWIAPGWAWDVATVVMLLATVLLAGSLMGNPAFPDPRGKPKGFGAPRGVFAITRHPMMMSFVLWAIVHIALWGSPTTLIVAGGVLILSLAGAYGQDLKKMRLMGRAWEDWMIATTFVPLQGQVMGRLSWRSAWPGWKAVLAGALIWLVANWAHAPLGGPTAGAARWLG